MLLYGHTKKEGFEYRMDRQNINVCVSCDDNYSKYAGVLITSILYNAAEDDKLSIYILDGGISQEKKEQILSLKSIKDCNINFIQINPELFSQYAKVKTHNYISIATYYRLKLAQLLPDIDKIIYLDCDMVVNTSLKKLFNADLHENPIAGVLDARVKHKKKWKNSGYINAGMILFDLKKIREGQIENIFYEYTKANIRLIKTGDQDIINFSLKNKIEILPDTWNVQVSGFASRTSFEKNPSIIHYIGSDKPWIYASNTFFKDFYFKYLDLTPWKLTDAEKVIWLDENKKASRKRFWKRRSLCFLNPKYWYAFYRSYIV